MFWNKACPKCKGSLVDDRDKFGYFIFCLQCGYYANEAQVGYLKGLASMVHSQAVVR